MPSAKRGFTLVELLVVMGIIGLLAAVLLSSFSSTLTSAKAVVSMNNLRQLAEANITYAADHDGYYCPASNDNSLSILWCGTLVGSSYDLSQGYLSPYLGQSKQVKTCPLLASIQLDPSHDESTGGYGYNDTYIGGSNGTFQPIKAASVPRPAMTVMFTTTGWAWATGIQEYPFCKPPLWTPSTIHFRDRGHALVAWCDGHVTAELPTQITYGGTPSQPALGYFGPTVNNGYWNPAYTGP
jgi:prepilin-type N-terminal cleavage/methylation domain-containing protein/prepilin-type processing-associated H-X9-DG protein